MIEDLGVLIGKIERNQKERKEFYDYSYAIHLAPRMSNASPNSSFMSIGHKMLLSKNGSSMTNGGQQMLLEDGSPVRNDHQIKVFDEPPTAAE